jgi:long-subunit fatty acid transport protein
MVGVLSDVGFGYKLGILVEISEDSLSEYVSFLHQSKMNSELTVCIWYLKA